MEINTIYEKFKSVLKISSGLNSSLYDHLVKILCYIHIEAPKDPYKHFEAISRHVKSFNNSENQSQEKSSDEGKLVCEYFKTCEKIIEKVSTIHSIPQLLEEKDVFLLNTNLLSFGGVIFDETEALFLQIALLKLANSEKSKSIRFWGKILGIEKDYYIAEAKRASKRANYDSDSKDANVNESSSYDYWYFNDLGDLTWVKLGDLDLSKIEQVKNSKCILSGNPKKIYEGGTSFEGTEEVYLRTLLEIISVATIVEFKVGNDNTTENRSSTRSFTQSIQSLNASELSSWTYTRVLRQNSSEGSNRTNSTESLDRSVSVSADDSVSEIKKSLKHNFNVDGYADSTIHKFPKEYHYDNNFIQFIYVLRFNKWPGAVAIFDGNQVMCVYIGMGLPISKDVIYGMIPQDIMNEPDEPEEQVEPQPQVLSDSEKESIE